MYMYHLTFTNDTTLHEQPVKDINNAKIYHNKYPSAQLRVYTGVDYKVYDQGGVIYSLDEIVVTGNKQ